MGKTLAVALVLGALLFPTSAMALENEELLALVAMPLAVAAVSEITDVPMTDLLDVVTLLNDAAVPPAQFIEVVRYVPVALIDDPNDDFVEFVRLREREGLRGTALVTSIEERIRLEGLPDIELDVTRPRIVDIREDDFIPVIVRERIAEKKAHPHGGPPGQLKKAAGVQTGAEIVHGGRPRRGSDDDGRVRVVRGNDHHDRRVSGRVIDEDKRPKAMKRASDDRGHGRGKSNSGGGKGKGKGKG